MAFIVDCRFFLNIIIIANNIIFRSNIAVATITKQSNLIPTYSK